MALKNEIVAPIEAELSHFEPYFKKSTKTSIPFLDTIMNYILRRKGKQMRPMLVFLSAKLNGKFNDRTYHAALTIELLHTATLVHDDVVDESYQRRGFLFRQCHLEKQNCSTGRRFCIGQRNAMVH